MHNKPFNKPSFVCTVFMIYHLLGADHAEWFVKKCNRTPAKRKSIAKEMELENEGTFGSLERVGYQLSLLVKYHDEIVGEDFANDVIKTAVYLAK